VTMPSCGSVAAHTAALMSWARRLPALRMCTGFTLPTDGVSIVKGVYMRHGYFDMFQPLERQGQMASHPHNDSRRSGLDLIFDSTIMRAHQHAAGAKKAAQNQDLGRSCGGLSTNIHVAVPGGSARPQSAAGIRVSCWYVCWHLLAILDHKPLNTRQNLPMA
jgi:hypothetical protein